MAFYPSNLQLILTKKIPTKHSKHYIETPIWRVKKDDNYVVDYGKFNEYIEEPFENKDDLFTIELSYDNSIVSEDGMIEIKIPRDSIDNYDTSEFNYGKVNFYYDETHSEKFYLWTISKKIIVSELSYIRFTFAYDIIPTFLKQLSSQNLFISMSSRSFNIFPSVDTSLKDEKKIREERLSYNIVCDATCESKSALFYNHHFQKKDGTPDYEMGIVFKIRKPDEITGEMYTRGMESIEVVNGKWETKVLEEDDFQDSYLNSVNLTPIYFGSSFFKAISNNCSSGEISRFSNFKQAFDSYTKLSTVNGNDTCLSKYFSGLYQPENSRMIIFQYKNGRIAKNMVLKFNKDRGYDSLKRRIPYHYQQLHTKFFTRSSQQDFSELDSNIVFYNGYDFSNKDKWVNDFKIAISRRMTTTSEYYDVYWNPDLGVASFNQMDLKPIMSFETWARLYTAESDLTSYLKENQERRRIDRQAEVSKTIYSGIKSTLIGAGSFLALGLGPVGAAIGLGIGAITFLGSFLINEIGTQDNPRDRDRALLEDLSNRSSSIPNTLSGEFITSYNFMEYTKMHPTSFFITESIGFGWEWKYLYNPPEYGKASQKQIDSLINFGERVENDFSNFNLFAFIVNNKTDQEVFYIKTKSCKAVNEVFYSNLIENVQISFCEFLNSGTRFRFYDEE